LFTVESFGTNMNLYDDFASIETSDVKNELSFSGYTEMKDNSHMVSPVAMSPESSTTVRLPRRVTAMHTT